MTPSEQEIEREIQAKGLNAPRLTPERIDEVIVGEYYGLGTDLFLAPGEPVMRKCPAPLALLTICVLVLKNGFTVVGTSACASAANFDETIGRKIAREKAREQVWALEGYLLKEELSRASAFSAAAAMNDAVREVHALVSEKRPASAAPVPSPGRMVLYYEGDWEACGASFPHAMTGDWECQKAFVERHGAEARGTNGTRLHPAIITNVWGPDCVNLIVFFDAVGPQVKTSMSRLPDEAFADGVHCTNSGWRWPPRV